MLKKYLLVIPLVSGSLTGCATLGASSDFGCKAPDGVACDSLSGTYSNALQHNLPGQNVHHVSKNQSSESASVSDDGDDDLLGINSTPKEEKKPAVPEALKSFESNRNSSGYLASSSMMQGIPVLAGQKVMKVTIFSWEDSDKNLHESSDVFIKINSNKWQVPHVKSEDAVKSFGDSFGTVVGGK